MTTHLVEWWDSPKLKRRSHSSFQASCARRSLLAALSGEREEGTVHTAFGSAYGCGAQALMQGKDMDTAVWEAFLAFDGDLEELDDSRSRKSIWTAIDALKRFQVIWEHVLSQEYELLFFDGANGERIPAIELSFRLDFANGYYFIGYVDAVLINKFTGELVVLELKTTADAQVPESKYKNSNQALGYGIVLDYFADIIGASGASYKVLYLVYGTKEQEFQPYPFDKTALDRVNWLRDTVTKFSFWDYYVRDKHFPKNGDSCFSFGRTCQFFGSCDMPPEQLFNAQLWQSFGRDEEHGYHVRLSYEELLDRQRKLAERV